MTGSASRVRKRFGFAGVVGLVALTAFLITLHWPTLSEAVKAVGPRDKVEALSVRGDSAFARASLTCRVARVTDGDTLRCQDGTRIRLHAVAARETDETCAPGHPCPAASAAAATSELRRLASGRTLQCEPVGQSYDRVTAICWTAEAVEINCAMVRSRTAVLWERFHRQTPICRGEAGP